MDHTIKIGGEAGQGIQTIGDALGKVFSRAGYHVFTNQDYESRIRGGHNFYQIRLSDQPVLSPRRGLDVLVALDTESITSHENEVLESGIIIYDSALLKKSFDGPKFFDVPFIKLATDVGAGKIVANTVATGTILGMLGFSLDILFNILKEILKKKDDRTHELNRQAARAGYEFAQKNCTRCAFSLNRQANRRCSLAAARRSGSGRWLEDVHSTAHTRCRHRRVSWFLSGRRPPSTVY
jgi:2-oxoglutarate/2-oxoacid ferredoxin oxidoreductase subunit alpha